MDIAQYYDEKTKIITMPDEEVEVVEHGIGYYLHHNMKEYADKIMQIDAATGVKETYASFHKRCIQTVRGLQKLGVKKGDIVSICSVNNMNNTVPYIAAFLMGAKIACLDPSLSKEDTKQLITVATPKVIFASKNAEELIANSLKELNIDVHLIVFADTQKHVKFEDFLVEGNEEQFEPEDVDVEEVAMILFSSGTTGMPKGICQNHKMLWHFSKEGHLLRCFLGFATLYWSSASLFSLATIMYGKTKVVCEKFDPVQTWKYLEKYEVNFCFMAPCDAIQFYLNKPENHISPLNALMIGGSALSEDYLEDIKGALPATIVLYTYGQTELFVILNNTHPILKKKVLSLGLPIKNRAYKIVDPETEETLSFNQPGELRVKTTFCMSGYYNRDSSDAWDEQGFYKTGDVFYYDEDFCFYMVDRIKEMFKYKSWHIVPAKIEAILTSHPDVVMAVVVGVPHEEDDNHTLAIVVPRENNIANEDEIKRYVEEHMDDRHKLRAGLVFTKTLPFTPSGKVKRRELRNMFLKGEL